MKLLKNPLAWVIFIALGFRIGGLDYGLPYFFHPDEKRQILETFGMAQAGNLLPLNGVYPALHNYLLLILYGVIWGVGRLIGYYQIPEDMGLHCLTDSSLFILASRSLSVLLGVAVVIGVYRIASLCFGRTVGWVSAFLAATNFLLVQISQWALPDPLMICCSTFSLLFLALWVHTEHKRYLIGAALMAGLALASKYQGIFLIAPLMVAVVMIGGKKRLSCGATVILFFLVGSLTGCFGWFFRTEMLLERFLALGGAARFGISSAPLFSHNVFDLTRWFFVELWHQQGVLAGVFLLGILWALIRRTHLDVLFLVFIAAVFFGMSQSSIRYLYLASLVFPVLCVLGGRMLVQCVHWITRGRSIGISIILGLILSTPSMVASVEASRLKSQPDTRELAKEWIEDFVPEGSQVAIDWYDFGPPLTSLIPAPLEGPRTSQSKGGHLSESLHRRYLEWVQEQGDMYKVVSMLSPSVEPIWPSRMPQEALHRAQNSAFFRRLYSWFHFKDLDELKGQGVQWLVVSSFSYSHFLLDDDPQKRPLFNPFFKENLLANNRQASMYQSNYDGGLLFFLVQEAREYYDPFLKNPEQYGLQLVQEFNPSKEHWGPVIKIFKWLHKEGV